MRKGLMSLAAAAALAIAPWGGAQAASCKGLNAVYGLDGEPHFELKLVKPKVHLAWSDLEVTLKTPTRALRFTLTASNGYSFNYLVQEEPKLPKSAGDDAGSFHIFFFDKKLKTLELPQAKARAPDYIFAPDVGSALWYGMEPREFMPMAMWRLKTCPSAPQP
jgi:hypothetical protein